MKYDKGKQSYSVFNYMILQERDSNREEYVRMKNRQTDNFKVDAKSCKRCPKSEAILNDKLNTENIITEGETYYMTNTVYKNVIGRIFFLKMKYH